MCFDAAIIVTILITIIPSLLLSILSQNDMQLTLALEI